MPKVITVWVRNLNEFVMALLMTGVGCGPCAFLGRPYGRVNVQESLISLCHTLKHDWFPP
jgi:hypothetical protein